MKPASRWFLAVCVLGSAITALTTTAALRVRAHGSEARYVREVDWSRPRIAHTYGLSYSELGMGAYRNEVETRRVGGRQCVAGGLIGFDVDDGYAFDVDEPVNIQRDTVRDENTWAQVAAEDVHVANLLQMGNMAGTHFGQPAWGAAGRFERDGHALVSGQEDPRTVHRGHTIHHNLQRPLHVGPESYFLYHRVFEESRRQGGVSGYAHQAELFNGRRGIALDVPFGIVDFVEILQQGRLPTDLWYGFLNLGYKLLPAAGSDFPYMDLPGVVRSYAKIDGPFSVDAWFDAFRAGRIFVTNGPLLEVTANGRPLGDELHVEPGATVEVVAEASLNPDLDRLDRLELVVHGEIVATEPANDRDRVRLRATVTADRSLWLAVRAFGERQERGNLTVAHSAPIYVIVEGRPFYRDERVPELVALQRTRLRELLTEAVDPNRDLEPWETRSLLSEMWPAQRRLLEPRVEEADARYRALLAAVEDSQR